jgi:asparagine synthase (glutamine-hydrolysing)
MAASDRLSAPFGISVEMPFISPEIVDVALQLPSRLKADGGIAKPVLKTLAARYYPKELVYRNKQGFPTPTSRWLGGPLGHCRSTLSEERTASRGVLDLAALRAAEVGRDDEAIWTSMCLEMICRQFIDGEGGPESSRTPTAVACP